MILFNTPIRIKYLHRTFSDWFNMLLLRENRDNRLAKLHFVYFSYSPDFNYLMLSLRSLVRNFDSSVIAAVNIFVDNKAPFNEEQIFHLSCVCNKIKFHSVTNFCWASKESTLAELRCFESVLNDMQYSDVLVKTDSDILFFSSYKMGKILKSGLGAAGDGHVEGYKFAQGGLYMLRKNVIEEYLSELTDQYINNIVDDIGSPAEDRVISKILENNRAAFFYTRLMLFPWEYNKLSKITRFNKFDFCAAHFVKDKDRMSYFENNILK